MGWVARRPRMHIRRRVTEDEIADRLCVHRLAIELRERSKVDPYLWKAVPVESDRMQQLPERKRLQHPAPEPPGPLLLHLPARLETPDEAAVLGHVPGELQRAEDSKERDGHAEMLGRVDAEHEPGERRADGGGVCGSESGGSARVAAAEGLRAGIEDVSPKAGEKAEEEAVEEKDGGEREGESEGIGLVEGLLLRRGVPG